MKQSSSDGFENWKAFARQQRDQFMERFKVDGARYQFGMRLFWLVLGTACAAIGWELLTILIR
jgi:hypothetical protein